MSRVFILCGTIAIAMACVAPSADPKPVTGLQGTSTVTVPLPGGDPVAGRQAFLDLQCTACHRVPSEPAFPLPVSANPGPPIDARLAGRDVAYLATSIIAPSHQLSLATATVVREHLQGVLSPMGDFSRVMTVRQLVDLHAYLRSTMR
jgi:hypothetical protein